GHSFHDYLRGCKVTSFDAANETLKIEVKAPKLASSEAESIRSCVEKACFQILGFKPNLEVTSGSKNADPKVTFDGGPEAEKLATITSPSQQDEGIVPNLMLQPALDFGSFVVGPSNQLAAAACSAVAENPGKAYNPLFIHGAVGLGKTHLLNAVARKLHGRFKNIRFISCEEFVNSFVKALKDGDVETMRRDLRSSDLLIIDDIHFLAGKEQTQEEFFHTFNHMYQQGKQIVLSSDSLPRDIPNLEDRLISRFHWGLAVKIEPPCTETRMAIVRKKAEARGFDLPSDVVGFLADNIVTNVRELEGAVVQLTALSTMSEKPITLPLAHEALRHLVKAKPIPTRIAPDDIIEVVCEHYNVRLNELLSQRRTKNLAFPRHVAMFLAKELTQLTLTEIGNFFGGRDHSTVLHAINKIKGMRLKDVDLRSEIERFELQLRRPMA
ncbi:MAG: chromosomal replication initiator protein DnaA, partial [Planctomycetota bacterium]